VCRVSSTCNCNCRPPSQPRPLSHAACCKFPSACRLYMSLGISGPPRLLLLLRLPIHPHPAPLWQLKWLFNSQTVAGTGSKSMQCLFAHAAVNCAAKYATHLRLFLPSLNSSLCCLRSIFPSPMSNSRPGLPKHTAHKGPQLLVRSSEILE